MRRRRCAQLTHNRSHPWVKPTVLWIRRGASVSQKWPIYLLMVQRFTPGTWNMICRIKPSSPEDKIRQRATHDIMTRPIKHKVNIWMSWFLTSFYFNLYSLSLSLPLSHVCVCVCCGVSPPCPHHLCSIRLIVLYNLHWCVLLISPLFMLPYFDYPISKPMLHSP